MPAGRVTRACCGIAASLSWGWRIWFFPGAGCMTYLVKEIYYTLQGEGTHTGRPAVFCRFSYCNLWTGREKDRWRATCQFCDTDFVGTNGPGGGKFPTVADLVTAVSA